jgi:signal transduction histidine kinase
MKRRFPLLLLSLWAAWGCLAQQPVVTAWRYGPDEGLPSAEVYHIYQDKQGYMWFATDRGLSRFDGYSFWNFGVNEGLEDLVVFQIAEDPRGRLWALTLSNRLFFLEGDSFLPYPYNKQLQMRTERPLGLGAFHFDEDGNLNFAQVSDGFFRYHPKQDSLDRLPGCKGVLVIRDEENWKGRSFFVGESIALAYLTRRELSLYASSGNHLQVCIETSKKKWLIDLEIQPELNVPSLNTPKYGWVKPAESHYLFQLFNTFYFVRDGRLLWSHFDSAEMECMHISSDGAIWMGGRSGAGLRRYEKISDIPRGVYQPVLRGISISHIFEDKDGIIWVGTLEDGVYCLPPVQIDSYDQRSGLMGDYIIDLALKDSTCILFTTQNKFLGELNIEKNTLKHTPILGNTTNYLYWDAGRKELWMSDNEISYRKGEEWRYLAGDYAVPKRFFPLSSPSGALALNSAFGIIAFSTGSKEVFISNNNDDLEFKDRTFCIHQDQSGAIWLGTINGLKRLNGKKLADPYLERPEFKARVNALAELSDGTLVVGTQGLGVLLWKNEHIQILDAKTGLSSDIVECLHVDESGLLWVGTRKGLNRVELDRKRNVQIQVLTTFQGLPSNQINVIDSHGNHVWVGTSKGLAHIYKQTKPETAGPRTDTEAFTPVIQSLRVGQESWPLTGELHFSYRQNDLVLQYTALDYLQRGKIRYRYRLNPSFNWNYTLDRTVNLAALAPGDYLFEVQAEILSGSGSYWSSPSSLEFSVGWPFWAQAWFLGLVILALLGLLAGAWLINTRRLKNKAALERRMHELERSALQAQMNPHFIFNALNSVQGFIQKGDKRNATKYLSKFARLMRLTLTHSRAARISLEEELVALREYLDLERMRMGYRFDYHVEVGEEVDLFAISIPPMLIQPLLENSVKHGIGPLETQGRIDLILRSDEGFLNVVVRDNGIGIRKSLEKNKQDIGKEPSLGMNITQQRLALLGGNPGAESIVVEELKDAQGQTIGAEARMKIRIET